MMGISRLGFVQVRVTDLEEAKRHYIAAVGLEKPKRKTVRSTLRAGTNGITTVS